MIEVSNLTKRYGRVVAVDHLSFEVKPGRVTGLLGPNGAGKTTTMRVILGLDSQSGGTALVNGRPFRQASRPLEEMGALLEARAVHGGRSAYNHLLALAQSNGISHGRVTEVLELVGLATVAARRPKGFSLGMSQRLGIAAALLGDPGILMFDEPINGLDPEGIYWMRNFMRRLAAEGRVVLVSSHLMSEMAITADHLVVIGRGRLIADTSVEEFVHDYGSTTVRVRSPQAAAFVPVLRSAGGEVQAEPDGSLKVSNLVVERVGELAAGAGVVLHELTAQASSLEDAYLAIADATTDYRAGGQPPEGAAPPAQPSTEVRSPRDELVP